MNSNIDDFIEEVRAAPGYVAGVLASQGLITEAGFDEQAKSYTTLATTGRTTAAAELDMANQTDTIAGEQRQLAAGQQQLAAQTQQARHNAATGNFLSGALKVVAAWGSGQLH